MSLTNALLAQWFDCALPMSINNAWSRGHLVRRRHHEFPGCCRPLAGASVISISGHRPAAGNAFLAPHLDASEGVPTPAGLRTPCMVLSRPDASEALRSAPLWQLNGSYFVCGMTVSLFTIHFILCHGPWVYARNCR